MPNRYALIIGNSEYSDSKLSKLRSPDSDVNVFAEILRKTNLGNFNEVEVLLNRDSATVRKTITKFFSNKKRDDLLLLYFSGHGVLDDRGRLFLAVKDTEHHLLRGTSLPASFITDEMDNCRSNRQILILDCCHSGAFARGTKGVIGKSVGISSAFMGTGYGRIVLTATDSTEYAWEGDKLLGIKQNSVFTHYLIKGIETGQADLDHDGLISIDELYDYAHDSVSGSMSKQTPGKWSFKQQGELIISKSPFNDQSVSETEETHPTEDIKHSNLVGQSLSIELLKSGIAGGLIATLLLLYPLYVYVPSLYVSGWYNSFAILAYPLILLSIIPIAWSGWLMARWAKSGWEAIFLGAQAGSIASLIAFTFVIANAAGVFALSPILKTLPRFIVNPNQVVAAVVSPTIALFKYTSFTWVAIELAGLLLGSLGCVFHMKRSGRKFSIPGFNLIFDVYWWKMILGGEIYTVLILPLSIMFYKFPIDGVARMASLAGHPVAGIDKTLLDWFPTIHPLLILLSVLIIACISTLGRVPDDPSQQRTIALYAILAAILPWVGPLTWFYSYVTYDFYSPVHIVFELLCAIAGIVLILFSFRLIRKSGWGKFFTITGRYFWITQTGNAFFFILLVTPTFFAGWFYITILDRSISILNGTFNMPVKEFITTVFEFQLLIIFIVFIIIWIIYVLLGALLKPFIWVLNGIVSLFPTQVPLKTDTQPVLAETSPSTDNDNQQSLAGKIQDYLLLIEDYLQLQENTRFFRAIGFIVGVPLILVIGLWVFSKPTPPPIPPSPTEDLFQLSLPLTNTPVIARATERFTPTPNPATATVGAAFTQIALATQIAYPLGTSTLTPTSSKTATVTPITTLTPTGALLLLDKNYACREGPGVEFPEVTSLASGLRLPILATNSKSGGWWLALIRLSVSQNAVCWIESGIVEGDVNRIPVIDVTP